MSGFAITRRIREALARVLAPDRAYEEEIAHLNEELEDLVRERTGQLRAFEERYRNVVRQAEEGIYLFEPATGRIRESNPAYQNLLGYTASELVEMTIFDVVAHDRESIEAEIRETASRGTHNLGERQYRRKDGSLVDVEVGTTMISQGDERLLCAIVRDITGRKQAEKELRSSKNSLAAAQRIARLGNFEYAVDRDEGHWSEELFNIFGFSPESFRPTYRNFMKLIHPEDKETVRRQIRRAFYVEDQDDIEYRVVRSNGELLHVHTYYEVIRDESGKPARLLGTIQDVTERRQSEERLRETESRYRALVEHMPVITYADAVNDSSATLYMSPQIEEMLGYTAEEWVSDDELWTNSLHPEDRERVLAEHLRTNETLDPFKMEYRMISREGRVVWVLDEAVAVWSDTGGAPRWQGNLTDITERKKAEQQAQGWARYSRTLFDVNLDALFTVDTEGLILDANPSMSAMTGVPREDLVGRNIFSFLPNEDLDREEFEETLTRGYAQDYETAIQSADGTLIPVLLNATVYHDDEGNIAGILTSARDTTERNRLLHELERQALHDSLTGLPNRVLLSDRLEHALRRASQEEESVAVLFVDLDRFKVVNDSLGHSAGDRLLKEATGRLLGCLGPGSTLARVGGDEFVVLLENVANAGESAIVANTVLTELRKPFEIEDQEVNVDASVGIALGKGGDSGSNLLRNADIAMYSAKRDKRSDYVIYDPEMNAQAQARLKTENGLRRGIERGELKVHYQPKVDLHDGSIYGFEALVRWESPERGMVSPVEFIPLAEETGLIIPIGRHVLHEACQRAKAWRDRYPRERPLVVAVNVSAVQLRRTDIVEEVRHALRSTGLPARSLCLEITESVIMEDVESNLTDLIRLKSLGVKIAIDDFGTGYSSLSYLKRFPVDLIKIDRSFVNRMELDSESAAIVESMVTLSHTLGLEVVAEGVEGQDQVELLQNLGCELAQGFLFSRPLDLPAANDLLAEVMLLGRNLAASG